MASQLFNKLRNFQRVGISGDHTPLVLLESLSSHLNGPRIWVKREDLTSEKVGGNKLRKLDFILHEAKSMGADTLVTGGVERSACLPQVAEAAAKLSLECHLAVFHGSIQPPVQQAAAPNNVSLSRDLGAKLHDVFWDGDRARSCKALSTMLRDQGKKPFIVPYGASNTLGAVAYASVAVEISAQSKAAGFLPAAILAPSVSGATQAGLSLGASIEMPSTKVIGIDISFNPELVRTKVASIARRAAATLNLSTKASTIEMSTWNSEAYYGWVHPAVQEAMSLALDLEALTLDTVFSGPALAGLIAQIRSGRWKPDDDIVFVHTGGAYPEYSLKHPDLGVAA